MINPRLAARLVAVAAVTLFGAGACAFDPQHDQPGAGPSPVSAAGGATGASASPGADQPSGSAPTSTAQPPVTSTTTAPKPASTRTATAARSSGCPQGEQQRQVETWLARLGGFGAVTVDGRQSAADCAAIKKFQQRYGIRPAQGRAGSTTADVARRLASTDTAKCQAGAGTTFCVDLTLQTVWAMRGRTVVMAPTVTRTGMAGYATPSGWYTINARNLKEWSNPYEVWLPYWQHFTQGMGFHETTTYLHEKSIGSHGCVNLLPTDARRMWSLGTVGTQVHLFGRRPGT
jgi:lipoprotein-anchoring transpeptidase ErfK/SrfK